MNKQRLSALLKMLGSNFDGEVINAARAADRMVRGSGMTWDDVVNNDVKSDIPHTAEIRHVYRFIEWGLVGAIWIDMILWIILLFVYPIYDLIYLALYIFAIVVKWRALLLLLLMIPAGITTIVGVVGLFVFCLFNPSGWLIPGFVVAFITFCIGYQKFAPIAKQLVRPHFPAIISVLATVIPVGMVALAMYATVAGR